MGRRRLSMHRGYRHKNNARRGPSVEHIFFTATDAEPKVFDLLVRNWKAVVLTVCDFAGRCLKFHHPKRSAWLVKLRAATIRVRTVHAFLTFFANRV
jgi:hypothetical protein